MTQHSAWFCLLSAALAGGVTLFDLDRTFVSGQGPQQAYRSLWWWGFVLANAAMAGVVYFSLRDVAPFSTWNSWSFAAVVGVSYLAFVRLKFATVSYQSQEIPVGLDTFYESGRQFVFRRINDQIKTNREKVARGYMDENDLKALGNKVRLSIELDALLSPEEKKTRLAWLLRVIQDGSFDEEQKRMTLAIYLAAGTQG